MCGISGIFNFSNYPVTIEDIKKTITPIKHRGPDGEGAFIEENFGLGHVRLSILDLTDAASQPMLSSSKRYVLSFNGEIYNYQELKSDLLKKGYSFKSHSDTEVLLSYFEEYGFSGIPHLNGHFAFAIYDRHAKKLSLVRDRFGVKPLYFYRDYHKVVFASEIKGILPLIDKKLDRSVLPEYFSFQNFFSEKTLFQGVEIVPRGTLIEFSMAGISKHSYHEFHFHGSDAHVTLEEIECALENAIKRQLIADVDVNIYLSGGIDSGLISIIASQYNKNLKSFTVGFDLSQVSGIEAGFDERENSEKMSGLIGSEHYTMVLKSGDMEKCLDSLVYHLEEPRIGQCYPNYYAAKLASKFGKVVLSGIGGDELFAGYPWRYYHTANALNAEDYKATYFSYWQRLLDSDELAQSFSEKQDKERVRLVFNTLIDSTIHGAYNPENHLNYSLEFEAKTFLHGLLCVEDKLSMAFGLETRAPFLDNELLEIAQRMSSNLKLKLDDTSFVNINENIQGIKKNLSYQQTNNGKIILRKLMDKKTPSHFKMPHKQGFSAPDATWFRGQSIELIRGDLLDKNAKIWAHMDYDFVKKLILEHLNGEKNRRLLLWSLLYFNRFLKVFEL